MHFLLLPAANVATLLQNQDAAAPSRSCSAQRPVCRTARSLPQPRREDVLPLLFLRLVESQEPVQEALRGAVEPVRRPHGVGPGPRRGHRGAHLVCEHLRGRGLGFLSMGAGGRPVVEEMGGAHAALARPPAAAQGPSILFAWRGAMSELPARVLTVPTPRPLPGHDSRTQQANPATTHTTPAAHSHNSHLQHHPHHAMPPYTACNLHAHSPRAPLPTLPSSTPHWSKELMPQTKPDTATRCSYSASSWPSVKGVSSGSSRLSEGRLPAGVAGWGEEGCDSAVWSVCVRV